MSILTYQQIVEEVRALVDVESLTKAPKYCLVHASIKSALAVEAYHRQDELGTLGAVTDCLIWQVFTGIEYAPSKVNDEVRDKKVKLSDLVRLNYDVSNSLMNFGNPYTFSAGIRKAISILGTSTMQQVEEHIKLMGY